MQNSYRNQWQWHTGQLFSDKTFFRLLEFHEFVLTAHQNTYSGVYGRASISFYAFNSSGNKGIACGLNNLQKIRDGEPLGGKASAESDFATDDDDDFLD